MKRSLVRLFLALLPLGAWVDVAAQTTPVSSPSGGIQMGGVSLAQGSAVFVPVDVYGHPIPVTLSGGTINLPGSPARPVGYSCTIASGAISGCSVPDEVTSSPSGFCYAVTISDTSLSGTRTSGMSFKLPCVHGITGGSDFRLDQYTPTATVPTLAALSVTSGSGAPTSACAGPCEYFDTTAHDFYFNPGTGWVEVSGSGGGGGGSMTWPSTPGIPVCSGTPCTAWGTSKAAPTGAVVGTSDSQTLTNKSIDAAEINSGTLNHARLPALLSGDIPNNAANTSGTAGGLSTNIAESQVTSLVSDLAAKVATSTTVNGHALSSNVAVTASDVGLGHINETTPGVETITQPIVVNDGSGSGLFWDAVEGDCTGVAPLAGHDKFCSDSVTHTTRYSPNGASFVSLPTSSGGGSGAWTNITGSVTASGCTAGSSTCITGSAVASITFSSIPGTYTALQLTCTFNTADSGATDLNAQFNGDTGSHYVWQNFYAVGSPPGSGGSGALVDHAEVAAIAGTPSGSNPGSFRLLIPNYANTTFNKTTIGESTRWNSSTAHLIVNYDSRWESTAAITSIKLYSGSGGNIVAGSICSIYGVQ